MTGSRMRHGALALMSVAALGAGSLVAVAATATASRSLTNGPQELSFSSSKLTVRIPKGKTKVRVTLRFRNTGVADHNIALRGKRLAARVSKDAPGGSPTPVTVSALVGPGTYTFYCAKPGHELSGMKGTLRVVR